MSKSQMNSSVAEAAERSMGPLRAELGLAKKEDTGRQIMAQCKEQLYKTRARLDQG